MHLIGILMLTPEQIQLITSTVPVLKESGVILTDYFYQRMFKHNPELKEVFNMGHQRSGDQAKALASAVLAYAANIENLAVLGDAVNQIITKHVSLNIQPEQYDIVGENLLASISEVLNVPMDSDLITAWGIAYTQLANILIEGEKQRYQALDQSEKGWSDWRAFKLVDKIVENDEVISFYFESADGEPISDYKAGQYISIRLFVPELGFKQPRQYTLSHYGSKNQYRISVKREDAKGNLASGYVSNALHNHLSIGDEVEISAPNGIFYLQNDERKNVFISAGIGITPMMAMLGQLKQVNAQNDIIFMHAYRNENVSTFRQEIEEYKTLLPNLTTYFTCEADNSQKIIPDNVGRLFIEKLDASLLPIDADYYICGPDPFITEQQQALIAYGIAESNIYTERFNTGN